MEAFTREDALAIASRHKQLRLNSCFQSAPELWLKLKGAIRTCEYPEQSNPSNDTKGYGPYPNGGVKVYGRKRIWFDKNHYDFPYTGMSERFLCELARGNPVVVSLSKAPNQWHGYLLYAAKGPGNFLLITKTSPTPSITLEDELIHFLPSKQTVDCLFMSRLHDRNVK